MCQIKNVITDINYDSKKTKQKLFVLLNIFYNILHFLLGYRCRKVAVTEITLPLKYLYRYNLKYRPIQIQLYLYTINNTVIQK